MANSKSHKRQTNASHLGLEATLWAGAPTGCAAMKAHHDESCTLAALRDALLSGELRVKHEN